MLQASLFEHVDRENEGQTWFQTLLEALEVQRGPAWPDDFGFALRSWFKSQVHEPIKALSLFSGGGGLDIAFHDAGFEVLESVELERVFAETLRQNSGPGRWFERANVNNIDIRDFRPKPDLAIDFIIGGPPCQTFSAAGRRAAGVQGTDDPRGTLFWEYVKLLKQLRPKGFLFENVYGVTGAQSGRAWQEIQTSFREAGYQIHSRILDAADYGVPQHRERLFIVGVRAGEYKFPFPTHGPDSPGEQPYYSAKEAVEGADTSGAALKISGQHGHLLGDIPPGLNYSFYTQKMGYPRPIFGWRSKFSDYLYKADPDTPVRTIKAQGGQYTGPFSWENRPFSVAELKRLQTFPDNYHLSGGRLNVIKQLGNSVPPQLGRVLALSILEQVMKIHLPFEMQYMDARHKLNFRSRKRALTGLYRAKADEAVSRLTREGKLFAYTPVAGQKGKFERYLTVNFAWLDKPKSGGQKIFVVYEIDADRWLLKTATSSNSFARQPVYTIRIDLSEGHEKILGAPVVELCGYDDTPEGFTALWKAFEEKLEQLTGKADLVQLFGYYQYRTEDTMRLELLSSASNKRAFWRALSKVVAGHGVAAQLSEASLAQVWEVSADSVLPVLRQLRQLGYEVRNRNTNPQIADGHFLVPYAFPTLTWRSVQLHKSLEAVA